MKTPFNRDLHERYLISLLSEIAKTCSGKIALKGGTSAMLFYDLPRFSFDLDLDILSQLTVQEIDSLREALSRHGSILEEQDKINTLFFLFSYAKGHHKIKIEMSKRIWNNNVYKNVWFMGMPLIIPDESTLCTNKLVALTNRKNPVARDLFDVWFFLSKGFPIRGELVKERTGKNVFDYLKYASVHISKAYTRRNVLQGLGNALEEKQKAWARDHLIDATIKILKQRL